DEHQIAEWWEAYPNAVPGIALGAAGLLVIDADRHGGPDGIRAFSDLIVNSGDVPIGPVTETAGGGQHFYFLQPTGETLGNGRGGLPEGIDVIGRGGFIVAQGAVRPDGVAYLSANG